MAKAKAVKVTKVMELTRPARKAGGDRYESEDMVIYIPQEISRANGKPLEKIKVTFEG